MSDAPVLVLGATGEQGGAVVAALRERGRTVRAAVRDPRRPSARKLESSGVEVVAGGFDDEAALAAAMNGAAAVFAMTTPFESGPDAEVEQGRTIIAAAGAAAVPHLVFSSVAGADHPTGVPHFESKAVVEHALTAGNTPFTILAPTYFYDNALGGADELAAGRLVLPLPPDRHLQQLSRRDLGRFAALVIDDPRTWIGRRIELASDDPTPRRMAAVLSEAMGRGIYHEQESLDAVRRRSEDMGAMWTFLAKDGYQADIAALRRDHPEIGWVDFAEWARATFVHGLRAAR